MNRPRREGFAGQHLLVVPAPLVAKARRHPLLRGLCVTDAGYFPAADQHFVERPRGAATTLIILCLAGRGWIKVGSQHREISAGHLAWLPADQPHSYGALAEEPWTIVWVHFTGDEIAAWGEFLGMTAGGFVPLTLPDDRLDEIALDQVYAALERGFAPIHLVAAAAALRHSFSQVRRTGGLPREARSAHDRVAASIEMLRHDWQRPRRLEELATAAKVSVTHYSSLFRRQTGFSPIDYLIRLRVRHACHLLDTSQLSVAQIAEGAGYDDPYYFTRLFRRVMGCSPRRYRQTLKG